MMAAKVSSGHSFGYRYTAFTVCRQCTRIPTVVAGCRRVRDDVIVDPDYGIAERDGYGVRREFEPRNVDGMSDGACVGCGYRSR